MASHLQAGGSTEGESSNALLVRIAGVVQLTGLGRSTIYKLIAEHQFPAPVRLTKRVVAWRRRDLEQWSDRRPSAAH